MGEEKLNYAGSQDKFANEPILAFTLRELQAILCNPRYWIGFTSVVAILTVAGPFGTQEDFNLPENLAYWTITSFFTFIVGLATSMSSGMAIYRVTGLEWISRALGGLIAGIPVAMLVYGINRFGFGLDMGSWTVFFRIMGYCAVISFAVSILYYLVSLETRGTEENGSVVQAPQPIAFFRRLPQHLGKNLIRISIQDHYVEAVTDQGKHLILMRFSDALEELYQMDGMQVHRSHWVNNQAVKKIHRKADRTTIEMTDGAIVPVSRSHLTTVRERFPV